MFMKCALGVTGAQGYAIELTRLQALLRPIDRHGPGRKLVLEEQSAIG